MGGDRFHFHFYKSVYVFMCTRTVVSAGTTEFPGGLVVSCGPWRPGGGVKVRRSLTENVDIDSGSGAAAAVGGLNDVGGAVVPLGLGDGDGGVSRRGVDAHPVVGLQHEVGLGPLDPRLRLPFHLGGKLNLTAGLGGQTRQQLGIQHDLWRLCVDEEQKIMREGLQLWLLQFHGHKTQIRTIEGLKGTGIN